MVLGWSPLIAGIAAWWFLRLRGNDRRGSWAGVVATAALALALVPFALFLIYLVAFAVGSVFFY